MNAYTEVLYYLKGLAESDPFVNTITKGNFDDVDKEKKNIFPLVHINIVNSTFSGLGLITFNVQIGAMDIRDINKEVRTDKFWEQDNEVDNLNEMLGVLYRIWLTLYKDFEGKGISTPDFPSVEPYSERFKNLLDGWIMTFNIEIPSDITLCES